MLENSIGNTNPKKDEEPIVPVNKDFSNIYWEAKEHQNFPDPEDDDIHSQPEKKSRPDDDFDH